ncbi:MAG TPA: ABC transporter permease [Candidatus Eisenbacteria bacterium]
MLVLLLLIWVVLARWGPWPPYLFPGPLDVGQALLAGLGDGSIGSSVLVSLKRLLVGFAISVVAGIVIGLLNARFTVMRETLGLLVLGLQSLPSICWLPLALLWFGLNESAVIFVVVMGSLLSVALAVEDAVRNIPAIYLKAARNMGASGIMLYRTVVLPASLPTVVSGLKQGWSFAWRALMAGELLFVGPGLGRLLMLGRDLNDMAQVIAVMLVIVAIGLGFDRLVFSPIERRLANAWGPTGIASG